MEVKLSSGKSIPIDAREGPTSRAPLNIAELRAMALLRSSLFSTMSMTKDCRVGMSKALMMPRHALSTKRCHTAMRCVSVRNARMEA